MKIWVKKQELLKHLIHAIGAIDRRGIMPILGHVLIKAQDGGITISATDLEIHYQGFCPARVEKLGMSAIPAIVFYDIIKKSPENTEIQIDGSKDSLGIEITSIRLGLLVNTQVGSFYHLAGLPPGQFPPIPRHPAKNLMEMKSCTLKEMIHKTIFSVGNDLQYNLSGISWERVESDEGSWLRLVSTDGHRLTLAERLLPDGEQLDLGEGILVPSKAMREIGRFLDGQEKVILGLSEKTLALQVADKHLFIRLLDRRKFPEYRRIIPEGFAYRFAVNRRELTDTLKCISQLSSDRFKGVIFKLAADSAEITFANPDVGEGRELVPVTLESGDASLLPIEIHLNLRYLLEPLNAMQSDLAILEVNEKDRPYRLRGQGDLHCFSIIMPIN